MCEVSYAIGGSAFLQRDGCCFGERLSRCYTMALIMVTISFPDGSFDNEIGNSVNSQDFEQFLTNDLMAFRS